MYIQKPSFVCTFRKCEMLRGARKTVIKPLFIRLLRFRGVFSYPVEKFSLKGILISKKYSIMEIGDVIHEK